jgi:iron complex outermembrane receptor protein
MKKCLAILTLITLSYSSIAQVAHGRLMGTVTDEAQKGVEAATVSLLSSKDSSLQKMSVTDKSGNYSFENLGYGKYFLSITAVGHAQLFSNLFEVKESNEVITMNPMVLKAESKSLSAVSVVARKPLIELKMDKTVVNVDAAVTNVGASALEVLEKSPGVTVDKDGNISLKGKQGVQVYIDGKPSYVSGSELVNLLKNMNASQLEQIEIMTNPPAKYDAAGNSGIINIKTKKNKSKGFNGSATAAFSQGAYWRTNGNVNLNYRNGRYNAFFNYSYNKNNSYQELTIHRTYKKGDLKTIDALFDQVAFMPSSNIGNNLKFGADYFVDKKTTIGFVASGFINPETWRNFNTAYLKNGYGELDSIVYATARTNDKWKNGNLNLNFRRQFDSSGRELSADVDYSTYASNNHQVFLNTAFDPNWVKMSQTNLLSNLPLSIDIYSAKVDYSQPIKKDLKLEAGVKSSFVNTDNAANYYNVNNGEASVDYKKTNQFLYKENINAAYINLNRQFKKFGIQAGVRFENTNYKGHQLGNKERPDSSFTNTYNNLFPTVYLSYNASKSHQFGLSFGRRIDRPAYQDLNPFLFFLDNYTYQAGNPYIRPQYTTNVELSHIFKGIINTTLNYSRTLDYMNETFEQSHDTTNADKGYATIVRQGNIGVRHNAGISISAQIPVTKWWSSSVYTNYNYNQFKGELYGELINVSAATVLFNVNNQFKFSKSWSAELSGFFRTRGVDGQIIIQPLGQASAGVSKQVMKGKGSIRFNMRDMFYTNMAKGHMNFQRTEVTFENRRDSRVGTISFTYRFGKPIKDQQAPRKNGGASDEQNRVKVSNG